MAPRKFNSEITVDAHDRWMFRGTEITQPEILKYFRKSLKQNDIGLYIENVFGELSEHGFLHTIGYPCHVVTIRSENEILYFYTDDDKVFKLPEFQLFQTPDDRIIGFDSDSPLIKYRLDWNAAGQLGNFLEEENGITYLNLKTRKMELGTYEGKIEVPLPAGYD